VGGGSGIDRDPSGRVLAALSSAVWFDFFLTAPYLTFVIIDRADIETTVL
jgi:hypothetical protein